MKKTAKEWFQQLPEPIRLKAINYWVYKRLYEYSDEDTFKSLPEAIGSIDWDRTEEGWHYWVDLHNDAEDGNFPNLHNWIPVSERLPTKEDADEFENVLILRENARKSITKYDMVRFCDKETTMWQPLPKLPEKL